MRWLVVVLGVAAAIILGACILGEKETVPPTPSPTRAFAKPLSIPHTLEARSQCLVCHTTGIGGASKAPDDHAGRTNDMCTLCHKEAAAQAPTPAVAATPTVPATTPTPAPAASPTAVAVSPTATPTPVAVAASPTPAVVQTATPAALSGDAATGKVSFEARPPPCEACHPGGQRGIGPSLVGLGRQQFFDAVRNGKGTMPAYTTSQVGDKALADMYAYVQSLYRPPDATAIPPPRPTPTEPALAPVPTRPAATVPAATPSPAATPTRPPEGPPAIPHTLVGRSDCLLCHSAGGIKPVPPDHAGRANPTCVLCHKPGM